MVILVGCSVSPNVSGFRIDKHYDDPIPSSPLAECQAGLFDKRLREVMMLIVEVPCFRYVDTLCVSRHLHMHDILILSQCP